MFVSVTGWVLLPPIATSPKPMLVGLALSRAVTPLPASETAVGELVALLTIETEPVALPVTVGANLTENVVLCPPARVRGRVSPLMLNPAPVTLA